jgi:hypothetical protein
MDPAFITNPQWDDISSLLFYLLFVPGVAILLAFTVLLAHGVIPSLIATEHLPAKLDRVRPGLYLGALALAGAFIFFFVSIATRTDVLKEIYSRWWT